MAYKSGFERSVAALLSSRKIKFTYETLKLPYTLERNYYPDFILDNGIIIEVKGYLDAESRAKMIAVKKQHPELDIRFLFANADKKVPGTKSTHGEWATRHGFPYAEERVPENWLKS